MREFQFSLDLKSGVPVYRQIIDQVLAARAAGRLESGDRLPTVRQVAVDLSINLNTVLRAYKELEIRGILTTQQGSGTFITADPVARDTVERSRRLQQLATDFISRAASEGYRLEELVEAIQERTAGSKDGRRWDKPKGGRE